MGLTVGGGGGGAEVFVEVVVGVVEIVMIILVERNFCDKLIHSSGIAKTKNLLEERLPAFGS